MATSDRRREQRRQRKAAERKKRLNLQRHLQKYAKSIVLGGVLDNVDRYPVHEAWMSREIIEGAGLGNAIICRKVGDGRFAVASFLVDKFLLGAKDAFLTLVSAAEYQDMLTKLREHQRLERVKPECVRKLVIEAVKYARSFGFQPHQDYKEARLIFGDIDASQCEQTFEFGHEGKPLYIQSPYDSPARVKEIMKTLSNRCGPGGSHYILPVNDPKEVDALLGRDPGTTPPPAADTGPA